MEKPKYYNKHIKDCSKECQEQVETIKKDKKLINVRCKECKSENWSECWTGFPLKVFCLDCKQVKLGEGNKLY